MKKALFIAGLLLGGGVAQAQLTVNAGGAKTFSGYDGQPAAVTGVLSEGVQGTLEALGAGTASFTYLGNESGNVNQFNFLVGGQVLNESSALGTTISGLVDPGAMSFSFTDLSTGGSFSNGDDAIVYVADRKTGYGTFSYIIGFNDNGSSDGDFDDYVVGVNITPAVPEPSTYAMLLAGMGAMGFMMRRRRQRGQS